MTRSTLLVVTLALCGCSQSTEPPPRPSAIPDTTVMPEPPAVPVKNTDVTPALPERPEAPTAFEYPADLGGRALARAVAPDRPTLTHDRDIPAPRPRGAVTRPPFPELVARVNLRLPAVPPAKVASGRPVQPVPPRERVPVELGRGSDQIPARPTFPVAAVVTERSRDVKLPPAMPTLGRPLAERVSLDDPTADLSHATIVAPPVKVTPAPAAFLKVSLPDPFELAEQVKPKVPPAAEPGRAPVVVDPQRVK